MRTSPKRDGHAQVWLLKKIIIKKAEKARDSESSSELTVAECLKALCVLFNTKKNGTKGQLSRMRIRKCEKRETQEEEKKQRKVRNRRRKGRAGKNKVSMRKGTTYKGGAF